MKTVLSIYLPQVRSLAQGRSTSSYAAALVLLALGLALLPIRWVEASVIGAFSIAVVILFPAAGAVLIALLLPFGRLVLLPLPGIGLLDGLVALTAGAWLLRGLAARRIDFRPPPLMWPLLAFVWIAGLSLTQAGSWQEGVTEWLKWGEFAIVYLLTAQVINTRNRLLVIIALFLAGLMQAAVGAYQFFGQVGPKAFILSGRFMRAHGTFQQPNPYAGYLGYLTPVAVSLGLAAVKQWWHTRKTQNLVIFVVCALIIVGLITGILMSWSRGAWMGLAAGLAIVVALSNRRTAAIAAGGILTLLLLTMLVGTSWLPESLIARVEGLGNYVSGANLAGTTEITDANFSVLERLAHWQAGLQMFADHPWLGVGIGNYAVAYPAYAPAHWYTPLGHAHNIFINFLAETGALGLAAFAVFWLGVGYWTLRRSRDAGQRGAIAVGLLGAWTYLTVHNLFDNLFVQHIQLQLALLLGTLAAEEQSPRSIWLRPKSST